MTNVTLKQLRYADALAAHGHFGRAASACSVTQPALSTQIKALERELGAVLFERGPRSVRPTRLGEKLVARAREVLRAVDDLADLARTEGQGWAGTLRLGMIPTLAPYLLPALVRRLRERRPELRPRVREAITPRLVEELRDGRLDMVLAALPVGEPSLETLPLFDEPFVLVRHASATAEPVPTGEGLLSDRLLLLEDGHCFRDQALAYCGAEPNEARDLLDASLLSTLVEMVAAGLGTTLLPEMAVPVETAGVAVEVRQLREPVPKRTIGMVWRRSSPLAPRLRELAPVVREAVAVARSRGPVPSPQLAFVSSVPASAALGSAGSTGTTTVPSVAAGVPESEGTGGM